MAALGGPPDWLSKPRRDPVLGQFLQIRAVHFDGLPDQGLRLGGGRVRGGGNQVGRRPGQTQNSG